MSEFTVEVPFGDLSPKQARTATLMGIQMIMKELGTLTDEVQQLKDEVRAESAEDTLTAEQLAAKDAKIEELRTKVDNADAVLQEARDALTAAQGGESAALERESEALGRLEDVLQAIRDAVAELKSDNPTTGGGTDPNAPYPDNTLPGAGSAGGEHPDNTLPEPEPYPDQSLPGDQPVVNPLKGKRR